MPEEFCKSLFCVHPAGGLSWCYAGLLREISPDRPVFGIQASVLAEDSQLPSSVEAVVADYTRAILEVQPHGPYHLTGWSFGGVVAHGIACRLQEAREEVRLLALLDAYPMDRNANYHKPTDEEVLSAIAANLGLDPAETAGVQLSYSSIMELARRIGRFVGNIEAEHSVHQARMLQHNGLLMLDYTLGRFDGDVVLFAATGPAGDIPVQTEVWAPYVMGRIYVESIRCRHPEMARPMNIRTIGRRLDQYLRHASELYRERSTTA
jgi:thioesterase domain-containing protein